MLKKSLWHLGHYLILFFILMPLCLVLGLFLSVLAIGVLAALLLFFPGSGSGQFSRVPDTSAVLQWAVAAPITSSVVVFGIYILGLYVRADLKGAGRENQLRREADEITRRWDQEESQG
jgi:FtsH-binding integral membrane protein